MCTTLMPLYIHWVDKMISVNLYITIDEVSSTPSFSKGSVMAFIEELSSSKVCGSWYHQYWQMHPKRRGKQSSLLVGTDTATGSEGFLLQIFTGNESILNLNPSGSHGMAPYNIPKEEEIQEWNVSWKNHGQNLLGWKGVFLWTSCLWRQQWLQTLYWNTEKSEFSPLLSLSHKKNCCISAMSRQRTYHGCSGGTELETRSRTES